MSEVVYERVASALQRLKLTRLAQCLDALAEEAATHKLTYLEFLDRLLEAEIVARSARRGHDFLGRSLAERPLFTSADRMRNTPSQTAGQALSLQDRPPRRRG